MNYKHMKLERRSNAFVLTFTDEKTLNALSSEFLNELSTVLDEVEAAVLADRSIRSLILTGSGKAFIAGADISEMNPKTAVEGSEFSGLGNSIMTKIENLRLPVIAAVNGFALGGGLETVLASDFAYASKKAKLGMPEVTIGLVPGFGGHKRLTDRVGKAAAKEIIYTGKMIDAEEALRLGIINKVCEPEQLLDEVIALSESMDKASPHSVAEAKELLNLCSENGTAAMTTFEKNKFGLIFSHPDMKEGTDAFLNKRKPNWRKSL